MRATGSWSTARDCRPACTLGGQRGTTSPARSTSSRTSSRTASPTTRRSLIYANESGALNEAFSDIMGTGVEFFFQQAGTRQRRRRLPGRRRRRRRRAASARWRTRGPSAIRTTTRSRYTGTDDNGGVHINSGIANPRLLPGDRRRHQSHLRAERAGRRRRNREQIEKVFYRAFTQLMPANARFATARAATMQAAQDLYPGNSADRQRADAGMDSGRGELRLLMRHITSTLGLITVCGLLGERSRRRAAASPFHHRGERRLPAVIQQLRRPPHVRSQSRDGFGRDRLSGRRRPALRRRRRLSDLEGARRRDRVLALHRRQHGAGGGHAPTSVVLSAEPPDLGRNGRPQPGRNGHPHPGAIPAPALRQTLRDTRRAGRACSIPGNRS